MNEITRRRFIEAASLAEAIDIASKSPCAVAQGVIEVWPLEGS